MIMKEERAKIKLKLKDLEEECISQRKNVS
jgi:hypothetical protein